MFTGYSSWTCLIYPSGISSGGEEYLANVIAASLTLSSLRFLITRIFRGLVGQVNLKTLPAGDDSSYDGFGGTISGFRNGNVGGGADDEGACCLNVGITWLGSPTVERNVDICRRAIAETGNRVFIVWEMFR